MHRQSYLYYSLTVLLLGNVSAASLSFYWTQSNFVSGPETHQLRSYEEGAGSSNLLTDVPASFNTGGVDTQGSLIYYTFNDYDFSGGTRTGYIRTRNLDGSGGSSLHTITGGSINAIETTATSLFYSTSEGGFANGGIYKIDLSGGSADQIISDTDARSLFVFENSLYYTDNGIWRSNLDGSNATLLVNQYALSLSVFKNKIYWSDDSVGGELFSANIDGSNVTSIADLTDGGLANGLPYDIEIKNGRIFYALEARTNSSGVTIASVKLDGSDQRVDFELRPEDIGIQFTAAYEFAIIPEPSSTSLLGLGCLSLILRRRK